jgi:hypothetical protein
MQQFEHHAEDQARENPLFRLPSPIGLSIANSLHLTQRLSRPRHPLSMEFLSLLFILAAGMHWLNTQGQRKRTALLAEQLRPYQIEKNMEQLTSAYMRALGESDLARQQQILQLQEQAEQQLTSEFQNLAREFAKLSAPPTRGFKLAIPHIDQLSPKFTFDMRRLLEVHAQGIERAVNNLNGLPAKERSFRMMGEMFLMQHSCHWFCKSKTIASARMVAQHQTRYEQALDAASPETRQAYLDVVQG